MYCSIEHSSRQDPSLKEGGLVKFDLVPSFSWLVNYLLSICEKEDICVVHEHGQEPAEGIYMYCDDKV